MSVHTGMCPALYVDYFISPLQVYKVNAIITPLVQIRRLRLGEVKHPDEDPWSLNGGAGAPTQVV